MSIDTKALIAATPATVALVRRELDKSRESQRGGRGTPKAVNVDCAMVERLCRIAEKQADRLAALQREQWVPVIERLPEKEQYPVLVAHQSGAVRMVFGIEPFIEGDWMGYYEPALQGRFLLGITHWMPLPPAPQPEEPRGINVSGHTYVRRSATSYVCRRCGHDMCREAPKPCANQRPEEAL